MGVDKATLTIDGIALGRRVAVALGVEEGRTVIACGGRQETAHVLGLAHLPDDQPGEGPLAAAATLLNAFAGQDVIAAACDLVGLDRLAVQQFEQPGILARYDAAVAFTGERQPSLIRWASASLPIIHQMIADGERSLHGALERLRILEVEVEPSSVVNLNSPHDIEVWQRS